MANTMPSGADQPEQQRQQQQRDEVWARLQEALARVDVLYCQVVTERAARYIEILTAVAASAAGDEPHEPDDAGASSCVWPSPTDV